MASKLVLSSGSVAGATDLSGDLAFPTFDAPPTGGFLIGPDPVTTSSSDSSSAAPVSALTAAPWSESSDAVTSADLSGPYEILSSPAPAGPLMAGWDPILRIGVVTNDPTLEAYWSSHDPLMTWRIDDEPLWYFNVDADSYVRTYLIGSSPFNIVPTFVHSGEVFVVGGGGNYNVQSGGDLVVQAGAQVSLIGVDSGALLDDFGSVGTVILGLGARAIVESGGVANEIDVGRGWLEVANGGVASTLRVQRHGLVQVESGGFVNAVLLQQSSELEIMSGGAVGSSVIGFWGPGALLKLDDAPAFSGTIGGFDVSDKFDLANIAFSGATLTYSGNSLSGILTVTDGTHVATMAMIGDYTSTGFYLADDGHGGTLVIDAPTSSGATIVTSGIYAIDTYVTYGTQDVMSGGYAGGAELSGLSESQTANQQVFNGGRVNETYIGKYGEQVVHSGGVATSSFVNGGTELIESGGTLNGATLNGGTIQIESGGTAGSSTISMVGGGLLKLDDAPAFSGAIANFFDDGDSIDLASIAFSGATLVSAGTVGSTTLTIGDGAHVATLTLLGDWTNHYGFTLVDDGRGGTTLTHVWINDYPGGGIAPNPDLAPELHSAFFGPDVYVVSSGGAEIVIDGSRIIDAAGAVTTMVVSSGGYGAILSGGWTDGATLNDGGELEIMSGGTAGSSTITFTHGGGLLKLDDAPAFGGTIAGFGVSGSIDLANIAFSAATLAYSGTGLSGVLTVNDGAHVATLAMLGDYVAANFQLADDGQGGTMVTDPPVSNGASLATPH